MARPGLFDLLLRCFLFVQHLMQWPCKTFLKLFEIPMKGCPLMMASFSLPSIQVSLNNNYGRNVLP